MSKKNVYRFSVYGLQGNVKGQGMGIFFLVMPCDMAPYWVDSKWFIAS